LSQSYMIVVKVLQTKKCPRSSGLDVIGQQY
jgi:hypothetical protein